MGYRRLDVRTEYAHEVSIAQQRDFQEFFEQHADEREIIQQLPVHPARRGGTRSSMMPIEKTKRGRGQHSPSPDGAAHAA
jgi:hypothetical protein